MMKFLFDSSLGRDFWNYRFGQLISLVGDSCSHIALAWWILEKTGSAAQMSSVLAPAMFVRIFLLPLVGPIGDRFARKKLIIFADLWRLIFTLVLAGMVYFDFYHQIILIIVFSLIAIGSSLFQAASGGIVPQIVEKNKLQTAMQQSQAINSLGSILGGILGGVVVSFLGVFGAFLIDSFSYLIAGFCTALIRADTKPKQISKPNVGSSFQRWISELLDGFRILYQLPVLFWICIIAMFMNLALSPLGVILPVLAKEARDMPAWYLGSLESSIGLGAVLGAFTLNLPKRLMSAHWLLLLSIAMIGIGVALLPFAPTVALPLTVLFGIGIGSTWANVIIGTQVSLSVPDHFRARVGSIMGFLCNGISPLGIAGVGLLISGFGLTQTLIFMGVWVVLMTPLMLFIPKFSQYIDASPEETGSFFEKNYRGVLK
jgi:MFS transporter, DHA3 family, macrolide efflux protein